jgi:hypothetical protein
LAFDESRPVDAGGFTEILSAVTLADEILENPQSKQAYRADNGLSDAGHF